MITASAIQETVSGKGTVLKHTPYGTTFPHAAPAPKKSLAAECLVTVVLNIPLTPSQKNAKLNCLSQTCH